MTNEDFERTSMSDLVTQINENFLSHIDSELQRNTLDLENKFAMKSELIMAKLLSEIKQLKS